MIVFSDCTMQASNNAAGAAALACDEEGGLPRTRGVVYVLKNASLKGMVKVGHTARTAREAAVELSGGALPTPFEVVHETAAVDDCKGLKACVHSTLAGSRIESGQEFFKCTPEEATLACEEAVRQAQQSVVTFVVPAGTKKIVLTFDEG